MDFHRLFTMIDRDSSGSISIIELKQALKQSGEEHLMDEILNGLDINGDGEISYMEYCSALDLIPNSDLVRKFIRK